MKTVFPHSFKAGHFLLPGASPLSSSFLQKLGVLAMPSKSSPSAICAGKYRGHHKKQLMLPKCFFHLPKCGAVAKPYITCLHKGSQLYR